MGEMNTDKEILDQYRGKNVHQKLRDFNLRIHEMVARAGSGNPVLGGTLQMVVPILMLFLNLLAVILLGLYKLPIRYTFFSIFICWWFYIPLTYIFEIIFKVNSWVLFDYSLIFNFDRLFSIHQATDQWLTLLVLGFSFLPVFTGLRFLLINKISLLMSWVFNTIMIIHLIFIKGSMSGIWYMSNSDLLNKGISDSGMSPLLLVIGVSGAFITLVLFWSQPHWLNPYSKAGLNGFMENEDNLLNTIMGDNNLKNPVRFF